MEKDLQLTVNVPTQVGERLSQLAAYHGRTRSEEMRRAFAIHDAEATLAYLGTPEAKLELGDDLPDARAKVKADLAELIRATYRRPEVPPLSMN